AKNWLTELMLNSVGCPAKFAVIRERSRFMAFAQSLGLRCPKTVVVSEASALEHAFDCLHFPIMVKLDGSWGGSGVRFAASRSEASRAVEALTGFSSRLGWRALGHHFRLRP